MCLGLTYGLLSTYTRVQIHFSDVSTHRADYVTHVDNVRMRITGSSRDLQLHVNSKLCRVIGW